eukprot:GHVS01013279.1.p1 GENE.GHVS01013279.1~~GHVS01013279.1.p1  ORF type:complete len:247 (-),score=64.85 GHVS01013279.1:962-1702(-)
MVGVLVVVVVVCTTATTTTTVTTTATTTATTTTTTATPTTIATTIATTTTTATTATTADEGGGRVVCPALTGVGSCGGRLELVFDKIRPSVVRLYWSTQKSQLNFLGSGYAYTEDHVVTAAHLFNDVAPNARLTLLTDDRQLVQAELVGRHTETDVAVVRVNGLPRLPPMELSESPQPPRQGHVVVTYGATEHGDEPVGVVGTVSQPRQTFSSLSAEQPVRYIQLALITVAGMSGSPVCDMVANRS